MTNHDPITIIQSTRVEEAQQEHVPVIDVRPAAMYEAEHIPGALNIPLVNPADGSMVPDDKLAAAIDAAGVKPQDDVVLYCQTGYHAGLAAQALARQGYTDIELYSGSMEDWTKQDLPVQR